eukprot:SAG31_NODE_38358_length_296_cov_4.685279_1_plen_57_part_10
MHDHAARRAYHATPDTPRASRARAAAAAAGRCAAALLGTLPNFAAQAYHTMPFQHCR